MVSFSFNKLSAICLGGDVSSVSVVCCHLQCYSGGGGPGSARQMPDQRLGPGLAPASAVCARCQEPPHSPFLPSEDDAQVYAAAV